MKEATRQELIGIRGEISSFDREKFEEVINNAAFNYIKDNDIKSVAVYYPLRSEVSLLSLVRQASKIGVIVSLPKIIGSIIKFCEWSCEDQLIEAKFALEPESSAKEITPELIFLPCVGWDKSGNRLGYGKGFYDRALKRYNGVKTIAIAFDEQEVEQIPVDEWDERVEFIITQTGLFKAEKNIL